MLTRRSLLDWAVKITQRENTRFSSTGFEYTTYIGDDSHHLSMLMPATARPGCHGGISSKTQQQFECQSNTVLPFSQSKVKRSLLDQHYCSVDMTDTNRKHKTPQYGIRAHHTGLSNHASASALSRSATIEFSVKPKQKSEC